MFHLTWIICFRSIDSHVKDSHANSTHDWYRWHVAAMIFPCSSPSRRHKWILWPATRLLHFNIHSCEFSFKKPHYRFETAYRAIIAQNFHSHMMRSAPHWHLFPFCQPKPKNVSACMAKQTFWLFSVVDGWLLLLLYWLLPSKMVKFAISSHFVEEKKARKKIEANCMLKCLGYFPLDLVMLGRAAKIDHWNGYKHSHCTKNCTQPFQAPIGRSNGRPTEAREEKSHTEAKRK